MPTTITLPVALLPIEALALIYREALANKVDHVAERVNWLIRSRLERDRGTAFSLGTSPINTAANEVAP